MLWLSEPDFAQHGSGPNSAVAKAALRSSDDNLALVLKTLADKNELDSTDIFVVSDHGFSTIGHAIFLPDILNAHGFHAAEEFKSAPQSNDIVVVNNGGSICLYVIGHDADTTQRLAAFLQTQPFAGVLFSQQNFPGTFPLSEAHINTPQPPDLVLALKWSADPSPTGLPGLIYSEIAKPSPDKPAKIGNHASLSPYDMHNTLIAAGPDIRPHFTDDLPSGNIDVAPTVLSILHVTPASPMDGRVLSEALTNGTAPTRDTQHLPHHRVHRTSHRHVDAVSANHHLRKQHLHRPRRRHLHPHLALKSSRPYPSLETPRGAVDNGVR